MINEILSKLRIEALNVMQQECYEAVLRADKDVVLLSPTGSGKTLAYLLPLVGLIDTSRDDVQALVVTPGRELALQSVQVLKRMGCGVRGVSCYGGRPAMEEHKTLKEVRPHIVFGTPGRLNDHLSKQNISPYHIRYIIIDEFDKCLEMGFSDEMSRLMDSLPGLQRRILLSATDAEQIPRYVKMERVLRLDHLAAAQQVPDRIALYRVNSPDRDKLDTLRRLLCQLGDGSSIVFLNYRDSVERTDEYLRRQGFATSAFHGGMEQKWREDALYKFMNGSANVMVSTDLASRGLDIPAVDNIIHYHLPQGEDGYVHRVGRTARWDACGQSYFIVGPGEEMPDFIDGDVADYAIQEEAKLRAPAQPRMATLYIGKGKKDKISRGDIVGFLCKKGGLLPDDIGRIDVNDRYAYVAVRRECTQQVLRLTRGEKIKGIRTVVEPVR